jgi:hypothetical protein
MEKVITLEIATPRGMFKENFEKTTKVQVVIAAVVQRMGLSGADRYELHYGDIVLQPIERPLVSFHLEGTVQLTLTATGSGV